MSADERPSDAAERPSDAAELVKDAGESAANERVNVVVSAYFNAFKNVVSPIIDIMFSDRPVVCRVRRVR